MTGAGPVTEQREARHADLDLRSTLELVELINDEDARVAPAVREAAADARRRDRRDRRAAGARRPAGLRRRGTSGRSRVVDAAECGPTFGLAEGRVVARVAADEAAEDDEPARSRGARCRDARAEDAVVVLSASGTTPYALGAARAAADAGALDGRRRLRPRLAARPRWPTTRSSRSPGPR